MTKGQFSFWLGLVGQTGCVIYDDGLRRESSDAARDATGDVAITARDASSDAPSFDVATFDAEASGEASLDAGAAFDVPSVDVRDAGESEDARDATADSVVDMGSAPESGPDIKGDTFDEPDGSDGDGPSDVFLDPTNDVIVLCPVDFNVSGVGWGDEGSADSGEAGTRVVHLVGDIGQFGAWDPTLGPAMTEKAPGSWSTTIWLPDRLTTQFKFVKTDGTLAPEWEQWLPFDSNRSFSVDCSADGGTHWVDAATDSGPANRAVGRSYGGAFGVRPLDATK